MTDNKPPVVSTYGDQQVANAKRNVCTAFEKVQQALDIAGARDGGSDPNAILTVAIGVRQVFDFGDRYLSAELAEDPATPADLAEAVRKLANAYRETTLGLLDELPNSALKLTVSAMDDATRTIQILCGSS